LHLEFFLPEPRYLALDERNCTAGGVRQFELIK
jgi:hypothetical protein